MGLRPPKAHLAELSADTGIPVTELMQVYMKHSKHFYYPEVKNARLTARAEAALDLLTALAIGISLAALLVAWWSA